MLPHVDGFDDAGPSLGQIEVVESGPFIRGLREQGSNPVEPFGENKSVLDDGAQVVVDIDHRRHAPSARPADPHQNVVTVTEDIGELGGPGDRCLIKLGDPGRQDMAVEFGIDLPGHENRKSNEECNSFAAIGLDEGADELVAIDARGSSTEPIEGAHR